METKKTKPQTKEEAIKTISREAAARLRNLKHGGVLITRDSLEKQARAWWSISFAHVPHADFSEAFAQIGKEVQRGAPLNPVSMDILRTRDGQLHVMGLARWANLAFPVVQFAGHKYAAALMATGSPSTGVIPPWSTFLIEIPGGLAQTAGPDGTLEDLAYILVSYHSVKDGKMVWTFDAFSREGATLSRVCFAPENMGDLIEIEEEALQLFGGEACSTEDDRTLLLLSRLVINTCVAMTDPDRVKKVGTHPRTEPVGPPRQAKEPVYRVYRVGKDIQMDCRPALRDYVKGIRRGPLTVQFLVRGHWRQQVCGPKGTLRKQIWIEPFWKGPEEAEIVTRKHVFS